MFWTKCGKLILKENGYLSECEQCPCGYYALFVFLRYNYTKNADPALDEVNYCYSDIIVEAHEVHNNQIRMSGGYGGDTCIEISRLPDQEGKCGYYKGCAGSYDMGNGEIYYYGCYEIQVYRISSRFDDYNEFAAWFYAPCNVQPDAGGVYPAIWEESYGQKYMSSTAQTCVQNYYYPIELSKWKPRCKIIFNNKNYVFKYHPSSSKYAMTTETMPDGSIYEYPDHYLCSSVMAETFLSNQPAVFTHFCYGGHCEWNGSGWEAFYPDCNETWAGYPDAFFAACSLGYSYEEQYELWNDDIVTDEITNHLCFSYGAYSGHGHSSYYGDHHRSLRLPCLTFVKSELTPTNATGVVILLTANLTKGTTNECIDDSGTVTKLYDIVLAINLACI